MKQLVSVILPIYNMEDFIERSLSSVINQTYKNLEIICVNDGSTDSTLDILNKFSATDNRITIINKENGGQSSARNAGLDIAKGEYISFLDPDDYLDLDFVETTLREANRGGYDIVKAQICKLIGNKIVTVVGYQGEVNYIDYTNDILLLNGKRGTPSSCAKLFKSEFIGNHRYKNIVGEDAIFLHELLLKKPKIMCLSASKYYYYIRIGSTTNSYDSNKFFNVFEYMGVVENILKKDHLLYSKTKKQLHSRKYILLFIGITRIALFTDKKSYKKECIKLQKEFKNKLNFSTIKFWKITLLDLKIKLKFRIPIFIYLLNKSLFRVLFRKYKKVSY